MDMESEPTHPMVRKEHIKKNHKPRLNLQILKVMATRKAKRRLSPLTKMFLLKWLESEFSSSVSSFTGAIDSSYAQRCSEVRIHSVLIGLTLAVTSDFITLFVVIIFHREFFFSNHL